jgi:citrate synthase
MGTGGWGLATLAAWPTLHGGANMDRMKMLEEILTRYKALSEPGKRAFEKDVEKTWKRQQRKRRAAGLPQLPAWPTTQRKDAEHV